MHISLAVRRTRHMRINDALYDSPSMLAECLFGGDVDVGVGVGGETAAATERLTMKLSRFKEI
jgi:hypothetical protein